MNPVDLNMEMDNIIALAEAVKDHLTESKSVLVYLESIEFHIGYILREYIDDIGPL